MITPNFTQSQSLPLTHTVPGDGPLSAKVVVLGTAPTWDNITSGRPYTHYAGRLLFDQFRNAGIPRSQIRTELICEELPPQGKYYLMDRALRARWEANCLERLRALKPTVIVALGEEPLRLLTDRKSIDKWHLSILPTNIGPKCVPLYSPERIVKVFKDIPFLTFGAQRVFEESSFEEIKRTERKFIIEPTYAEMLAYLKRLRDAEWLSVDIETGRGQITCVGLGAEPTEAICLPTLPDKYGGTDFYRLWREIDKTLNGPSKKVMQNGIYDTSYFSKYGVRVRNFAHDTMVAQKCLHPELPMGLDTVARLYTREPYWKDEGKDWGRRQDVRQLYTYNCKDVTVTLEAAHAQRTDLVRRGLLPLYDNFLMKMTAPVAEMSWRGLPVNLTEKERLRAAAEEKLTALKESLDLESQRLLNAPTNPNSPLQVKKLIRATGLRLPTRRGVETTDKESLLKLRLARPDIPSLDMLLKVRKEQKKLSSYLSFSPDADARMRYTLSLHGTESGRMSCYKDPWDNGMNAQTIPFGLKTMFEAQPGKLLIEVDLRQAESRFVAYDAPEPELIRMFEDNTDIHRFVASQPELFNCRSEEVTKEQRQLGKKAGHAAHYGMMAKRLAIICLTEMELDISEAKAERMLFGYHRTFPGIRSWQRKIEEEICATKMLKTPFGRERIFYDRIGPDLFREAYAYRPQSTVTDIVNHLILHLFGKAPLLLQVHDSVLLEIDERCLDEVLGLVKDQDSWNPKLKLVGGELRIPIEIKVGRNWGRLEEVFVG